MQFSENQSRSKMSNTVIHKTLMTVIILTSSLNKKKKRKKTMSGISRSRLLITATGKMCRRTIQSEFLAWIKGNAGEKCWNWKRPLSPSLGWSLAMLQSHQKQMASPAAKPYITEKNPTTNQEKPSSNLINGETANSILWNSVFKLR